MKVDGYKCDECGTEKKTSNHWFLVYDSQHGLLQFATWDKVDLTTTRPAREGDVKHICGQQCAQAVLEQWMNER